MLPLAVGAAHVLSGSCSLSSSSSSSCSCLQSDQSTREHTLTHLPTHLLLPAVTADAIVGTFGATRQYLCTATNTGWELGRAPNSELVAVQCVPGQDCLHSAQQLQVGYLPVAKHPPIRQLPVSSDQKSEGSEGRYGLLGAWHPGLPGARVGVVKAWQGPAAYFLSSPKNQVWKQPISKNTRSQPSLKVYTSIIGTDTIACQLPRQLGWPTIGCPSVT